MPYLVALNRHSLPFEGPTIRGVLKSVFCYISWDISRLLRSGPAQYGTLY